MASLTVGLGFISALGVNLFQEKRGVNQPARLALYRLLGLFITVFAAFILPDQGSYQLLPACLCHDSFALWFNKGKQQALGVIVEIARRPTMWTSYLSGQFFLPLLAIFYLIGYPLGE